MDANTVAVTIRNQIMVGEVPGCQNGRHAMMCWGFNAPMCGTEDDGLHYLVFKVSGRRFQGKVKVRLDGNDTYSIHFYKQSWDGWKMQDNNVYCEELAETLDAFIEK